MVERWVIASHSAKYPSQGKESPLINLAFFAFISCFCTLAI